MIILFWILLLTLAYAYVGYGVCAIVLGRFASQRDLASNVQPQKVCLIVAAHNESAAISNRLENALSLNTAPHDYKVIVATDGCTDDTADMVRKNHDPRLELIELEEHRGKAAALNVAVRHADADILIFTDANSVFSEDAVLRLLAPFGDASVGVVCGELKVAHEKKSLGIAEALYLWYDHALKRAEGKIAGPVSAQGSIYAIRHSLFEPFPSGVTDDFFQSTQVVLKGYRLVFEPRAVALEGVTDEVKKEFGRRIRSSERAWRGLIRHKALMNPLRYGMYAWQLISHKLIRRLTPFLLPAFYLVNAFVVTQGIVYLASFILQTMVYGLALVGIAHPSLARSRVCGIPMFFVLNHIGMGLGLLNLLRGVRSDKWITARSK